MQQSKAAAAGGEGAGVTPWIVRCDAVRCGWVDGCFGCKAGKIGGRVNSDMGSDRVIYIERKLFGFHTELFYQKLSIPFINCSLLLISLITENFH